LWSTSQGHSSLPGSVPPISDDTCDPSSHRPRSSGKLLNNGVVRVPLADKDSHPPMFTKPPPTPLNDSRPYVAYAPSNHSSFSAFVSSTRGRNYKKLVISGIGVDEHKRFDGVRRWCEVIISFPLFAFFLPPFTSSNRSSAELWSSPLYN
jgi:hypothetical protein